MLVFFVAQENSFNYDSSTYSFLYKSLTTLLKNNISSTEYVNNVIIFTNNTIKVSC